MVKEVILYIVASVIGLVLCILGLRSRYVRSFFGEVKSEADRIINCASDPGRKEITNAEPE